MANSDGYTIFDVASGEYPGADTQMFDQGAAAQAAPYLEDNREASFQAVPGNILKDIGENLSQGMGMAGSLGAQRAWEMMPAGGALPPLRLMPIHLNDTTVVPADINLTNPFDPTANVNRLVGGIAKSYYDIYAKPFEEGDIEKGLNSVGTYALKHPYNFATDVIPIAKFLGVGKLASAAGKLPGAQKASAALGNAKTAGLAKMHTIFDEVADSHEAVDALRQKAIAFKEGVDAAKAAKPMAEKFVGAMGREVASVDKFLRPLWEAIPKKLQSQVRAYAEGWHPALLRSQPIPAAIKDYLDAADTISNRNLERLKGLIPAEDLAKLDSNKYQGAAARMFAERQGAKSAKQVQQKLKEFAKLDQKIQEEYRKAAKMHLDDLGVTPRYSPWMKGSEISKTLKDPFTLNEKSVKKAGGAAELKKSGGAGFSDNHFQALKARSLQVGQYYHSVKGWMDQVMRNAQAFETTAEEAAKGIGHVDLHDVGVRLAQRTFGNALSEKNLKEMVSNLFPQQFAKMPANTAGAITQFFGGTDKLTGALGMMEKLAGFQRKYLLGLQPLYPEVQGVQNLFLLGLTQFNGFRDTLRSVMSYALAANPKFRELVPPQIIQGMDQAIDAGKAENVISKFANAQHARMAFYDTATRYIAAAKISLDIADKHPDFGKLCKSLSDTHSVLKALEHVLEDPQALAAIDKQIKRTLGDFSTAPGSAMQILKSVVLWPVWLREFSIIFQNLHTNHPYKMSILNHIAQFLPTVYGDPNLPEYMYRAGATRLRESSPDGNPYYINKGMWNPLQTAGEIAELMSSPFDDKTLPKWGGQLTLPFDLIATYGFRKSTFNGREFRDYRLVQDSSGQYDPQELLTAQREGRKPEPHHPTPDIFEYSARKMASFPVNATERLVEHAMSGGEKSDFTTLFGSSAPKRTSQGEIIQAPDWLTQLQMMAANIYATPIDIEKEQQSRAYVPKQNQQLYKKFVRQGFDASDPSRVRTVFDMLDSP